MFICKTLPFVFQVANLFARDEMDEITQELVPIMKKEYPRRPPTNENLYEYYLSRVRSNLHVVLCFSPVSAVTSLIFHGSVRLLAQSLV